MLKRRFRLKRRRDFQQVYQNGRLAQTQVFAARSRPNQLSYSRLAAVVSSKISKKAVVRNRNRRRLLGQLTKLRPKIKPGLDIVVAPRRDLSRHPAAEIEQELVSCLKILDVLH